jgi:hypothetical protein
MRSEGANELPHVLAVGVANYRIWLVFLFILIFYLTVTRFEYLINS